MCTLKRMAGLIFSVCLMAAVMIVPDTAAYAKASVSSQSVDMMPEFQNPDIIEITYDAANAQLKHIKTNNKNLIARQTYQKNRKEADRWDKENPYGCAKIGLYAKKTGTYKVTFDVYAGGKKASSHSVNVFVRSNTDTDYPIKKATFAGKTEFYGVTGKKSGKFKVTMNKNYKLKKIEVRTYDKNGREVVKTVKNGAKITLGAYAYKYENDYSYHSSYNSSWYYDLSTRLFAETSVRVYYQNTKTNAESSASYTLYRKPKN